MQGKVHSISRSSETVISYFSGSDVNVEIVPFVFSAEIDFLVLLYQILLLYIEYTESPSTPLLSLWSFWCH